MDTSKNGSCGKRPGVMLYYDMVEPILSLRDSEKGRLLMAIVAYSRESTEPEFTGRLALAWGYIQPKLDRDAEAYESTRIQRKYATFCRERSKKKLAKIPMEAWLEMTEEERKTMLSEDIGKHRADDSDDCRYPTGKGKRNGNRNGKGDGNGDGNGKGDGNTSVSSAAAADTASPLAAAAAERKLKRLHGELGQGVVNLSEYHIDRLLEQMGLEMFDYYVKKLSDFILKNDASVKNHYGTILRWWQEDNGL